MINIGIAGFGKIGQLRYDVLSKIKGVKVSYIFDVTRPKKLSDDIVFCESFDSLISHDIDAIFICAYNTVLAEYTIKAINKGLHVFCEKPPAMKLSELDQVKITLDQNPNIILKYGFNHRYHYSVMEAKKLIESKNMGKLLWIRGAYGKAGSIDYDKNWRNYKKYAGGGILIDQGIHMLDLIRYFSNEDFEEFKSYIETSYWNIEVEDNAFVLMKSKNNIIANIHSSATQWKHKFLLEMYFENGFINLDGILSGTRSYAPETIVYGKREFEDITFAMGKPQETVISFENDHSWQFEIDEFIGAINKQNNIIHGTLDDAYKTLSLVENIYKSANK